MLKNTYTYTARSADDSTEIMTFTLHDHQMSVDLGAPIEQAERALQAARDEGEPEEGGTEDFRSAIKPMAISLVERGTGPFDIADVDAEMMDDGLRVMSWVRTAGLRLAPISFMVDHVDNPDAAQAFVSELNRRKAEIEHPGTLPGPLDYWGSWILGFLTAGIVVAWLWRRRSQQSST
jgi:hypothetical protein